MVGEGVGDAIVAGGFVVPAAGRGVGLPATVDDEGKLHVAALVAVPDLQSSHARNGGQRSPASWFSSRTAATIVATFLLALALNGLDVLGMSAGAKPIFNGLVLVYAVALTQALRRRSAGDGLPRSHWECEKRHV